MDVESLKSVPLFAGIEDRELESVATWASEITVPAGKEVVREGDHSSELYVIEDGTATVVRGGEEIAKLGPGDAFGETGVIDKALRSATITAETRLHLVVVDHWSLTRLRKEAPTIAKRLDETKAEHQAAG